MKPPPATRSSRPTCRRPRRSHAAPASAALTMRRAPPAASMNDDVESGSVGDVGQLSPSRYAPDTRPLTTTEAWVRRTRQYPLGYLDQVRVRRPGAVSRPHASGPSDGGQPGGCAESDLHDTRCPAAPTAEHGPQPRHRIELQLRRSRSSGTAGQARGRTIRMPSGRSADHAARAAPIPGHARRRAARW